MERLEIKKIKGKSYYYYSKWGKVDGKCRRLWQKYLGTSEAILNIVKNKDDQKKVLYAEVFEFGLPLALWNESKTALIAEKVNLQCKKRKQKFSVGDYITLAAINRAATPTSKLSMWEWFSKTSLLRLFPLITESDLSSQQFWNHMDYIDHKDCKSIWESIIKHALTIENIDLSSISYDGTNYYTFIDTFNVRCSIAKRGKNKQGRSNLRQISYALFCTADGHIPLLYETYDGNLNDMSQFPVMLNKFMMFFDKLSDKEKIKKGVTLIFDKGNTSENNFKEIDKSQLHYITSTKLDQHKDFVEILSSDPRFIPCAGANLEDTKTLRVTKNFYEKDRTFVISYNQKLFNAQWMTLQTDLKKACEELLEIQKKLEDRVNGIITKGTKPTKASINKKCQDILHREYLKDIITTSVSIRKGFVRLKYNIEQDKQKQICETYLGKNIIMTNRAEWSDSEIVLGYRSQYIIESVFKESKDKKHGTWWPQFHWTDSKIHVHALYCTIALLLRAIMQRRVQLAGVKISMNRLLTSLEGIKEVVNVYSSSIGERQETTLTKLDDAQQKLTEILGLTLEGKSIS